ncbi:MAG: SCO family protein, partial [Ignavibacteriaceae bacterium]|nr:SCO family protein [Ignavibacteriaceae bacterium]
VKQNIKNIQFAAVSFDPDRDTPSLLKKFGKMRNINYSNWKFLTGVRDTVLELTKEMEIVAVSSDTTYLKDGSKSYFFTHTDRISLIDKRNRLRKEYVGTAVDIQEIIKDIKSLEE